MVKGTLRESKVLGRTGSQSPYELPCVTRVMYPPQGTELRTTLLQIQSPGEGIWKVQLRHVPASGLALWAMVPATWYRKVLKRQEGALPEKEEKKKGREEPSCWNKRSPSCTNSGLLGTRLPTYLDSWTYTRVPIHTHTFYTHMSVQKAV